MHVNFGHVFIKKKYNERKVYIFAIKFEFNVHPFLFMNERYVPNTTV